MIGFIKRVSVIYISLNTQVGHDDLPVNYQA